MSRLDPGIVTGEGQCQIEGCKIGTQGRRIETDAQGNLVSVEGLRRCLRSGISEAVIRQAAAQPLLFAETIRRETPAISSGEDGTGVGRCWAWEEFLVASGVGREVGGLGTRRGQSLSRAQAEEEEPSGKRPSDRDGRG